MRRILVTFMLLISGFLNAQTELIDAKKVNVRDSIRINGKWIKYIITDSALANATDRDLASAKAVKEYILNRFGTLYIKDTFTTNLVVNITPGRTFGKYVNGQTIPSIGKTANQVITEALTEAIPPIYYAPTAGLSSSPVGGSYEIGSNLGTITLSASFTQNDGGTSTGNTFSKFISSWNNLGSNADAITSLTSTTYYRVTTTYNQGACKNNNLGVQDCTGRINSGNVVSGNIQFTPFQKRYWGFVNSATPSDADILALTQDGNGTNIGLSLTNITPTGSQYLIYVRPNSGSVSSITVNGFPSTAAFTTTTRSFTNAQGYSSSYQIIVSNNAQTSILNSVIFQ